MGQGSHLTIANHTTGRLTRTAISSYQMKSWNLPESIDAGKEGSAYVEFDQGMFTTEKDDSGDAEYRLDSTGDVLKIEARKPGNFCVEAIVNGRRNDLGWLHDGQMRCDIYRGANGLFCPAGYNWQSNLPDTTLIQKLSIPGTHDSGTFAPKSVSLTDTACRVAFPAYGIGKAIFEIFQSGGATCQSLSFKDQLRYGIRFLDIRLTMVNDELYIQHGDNPTFAVTYDYTFEQVLNDVESFLKDSGEFVIMSIKKDMGADFDAVWNCKYKSRLVDSFDPATTTVKDVRGRIVAMSREDKIAGFRLRIANDTKDQRALNYRIQDNYNLKAHQTGDKKDSLRSFYNNTVADTTEQLSLSFASMVGGGTIPDPEGAARIINDWLRSDLLRGTPRGRTGILLMDFPSPELIQMIYTRNF